MKKLEAADILDLHTYELERDAFRARMIEYKQHRRVSVGDRLTFVFENRETVRFQIQEMARAERIVKPEALQLELDVYNELIPAPDALSATLMIEIPDLESVRAELDHLIGIDEHVYFDIGSEVLQARFDAKQFKEDRISAVQYIRFDLGASLAKQFQDPNTPVTLRVNHPHYEDATSIEAATRASLIKDLGA